MAALFDLITRGFHHAATAGCMDIYHPHAKIGSYADGFGAGIGNIVEFQVQKHVVTAFMQLLQNGRA